MSGSTRVRQAVVTAAGLGTRMRPASLLLQKELLPVAGTPALELLMWELADQAFDRLVVVTGGAGASVAALHEDAVRRGLELEVEVIAGVEPLGLGHAVAVGAAAVGGEPFALLLGDTLIERGRRLLSDLCDLFAAHRPQAVLTVSPLPESVLHRFGCVAVGTSPTGAGPHVVRVTGMVEKPPPGLAPSPLAVIGRYVLAPDVVAAGRGSALDLGAALDRAATDGDVLAVVVPRCWHDVGDPESAVEAAVGVALEHGLLTPASMERMAAALLAAAPSAGSGRASTGGGAVSPAAQGRRPAEQRAGATRSGRRRGGT